MSMEAMARAHLHRCSYTLPRRSLAPAVSRTLVLPAPRLVRVEQAKQSRRHRCRLVLQLSATVAESPVASTKTPNGFEVSEETLPGSRKRITITAPAKTCKKAWNTMIKQARKDVKVDGFRDMKSVTEATLLTFLGGKLGAKTAAVEEVVKHLPAEVGAYTKDAITETIMPVDLKEEKVLAFDVNEPFTYQIEFAFQPVLSWKRPYKGLKVEVAAAGDEESDQAKVEHELLQIQKRKGGLKVVQGRGLQLGDAALVDFDARRTDTGEVFEGAKRRKTHMDTASADMQFLPGVSEAMVGMKVGETRDVRLTLPDDFEPAGLRGCDVTCQVGVSELFEYELAELDDSLAEEVAPGAGGAKGLRAQLLKMQQEKSALDTDKAIDAALMQAVVQAASAEIPQHYIAEMGRQEFASKIHLAIAKKEIHPDQAKQLATEESLENYTKHHQEDIEEMVLQEMALETIFVAEKLSIPDEEFQLEYDEAKREFGEHEYDDAKLREQVLENLKAISIINWLRKHSDITLLPPSA
ncbi:hypothetical protein ABBQ38_009428 [Trebouxia sp. C0009 RCD-2024]